MAQDSRLCRSQVRSEVDPNFFLQYTDVYVGEPSIEEDAFTTTRATPFECRLRRPTTGRDLRFSLVFESVS